MFSLLGALSAFAQDEQSNRLTDDRASQRATLLAADLAPIAPIARRIKTMQVVSVVAGGVGLGIAVPLVARKGSPQLLAIGLAGSGTAFLVGGIASFAVPEDYSANVLYAAGNVSNGSLYLGLGLLAEDSRAPSVPPAVGYILASGFGANAALRFVDMAARRPVSYRTLASHYRKLWAPESRAALTAVDLEAIESDFERQGSWMAPYVLHAPVMIAGGAGVVYSVAARGLSDPERAWGATLSGINLVGAFAMAVDEDNSGWRLYRRHLYQTGLSISLAPGPATGASLVGRF